MDDFIIIVTLNLAKSNCKKLEGIALELISRAKEATISFNTITALAENGRTWLAELGRTLRSLLRH